MTERFAADVDERVRGAFCRINNITDGLDSTGRDLYETPLAYGGLGMRPLRDHRAAAFLGCWLQVMQHVRSHHGDAIPQFEQGWRGIPVHREALEDSSTSEPMRRHVRLVQCDHFRIRR